MNWTEDENCRWLSTSRRLKQQTDLPLLLLEKFRKCRKNKSILEKMVVEHEILRHINVVSSDLIYTYETTAGDGGIKFHKAKDRWSGKEAIMKSKLKHTYLVGVIECMKNCKLIDFWQGERPIEQSDGTFSKGQVSRMRMRINFAIMVRKMGIELKIADDEPQVTIKRFTGKKKKCTRKNKKGEETIYFKDELEVIPVTSADTDAPTQKMIADITVFNHLLSKTHIQYKCSRSETCHPLMRLTD